MIGNDTIFLTVEPGIFNGAAQALRCYTRPRPAYRPTPLWSPAVALENTPGYRLAATVTTLRCAINLAKGALGIDRPDLALAALNAV